MRGWGERKEETERKEGRRREERKEGGNRGETGKGRSEEGEKKGEREKRKRPKVAQESMPVLRGFQELDLFLGISILLQPA